MRAGKLRVLAGRGVVAAAVAAVAAACSHAASPTSPAALAAGQTPGPATPSVTPSTVPVLGPMTYGTFPATKDGMSALRLCEQWSELRGQYVARVQAQHTAYQLEQWFSGPVWQAAFGASNPLRVDASYSEISVAFVVATSGDVASIPNAKMLDRACAAAD
ncbi:MAG: hypothetical protein ACRDNO_01550 [Trebonia sp.]